MKEDSRYTYAVGRIRALETRLLRRDRFDDMLEAEDADSVLRTLADTDYGQVLSEIKSPDEFEFALNRELKRVLQLISHLSWDRDLSDLFPLRYDFHNLKVLLKQRYFPQEEMNSLIDAGLLETEKLRKIIEEEKYTELPEELQVAVERATKNFEESRDPQRIDIMLDKEMYKLFHRRCVRNQFLARYFQIKTDLTNIKTFLRLRELRRGRDFFEDVFLDGGSLEKSLLLKAYEEPIDSLPSILSPTPYGQLVSDGIKWWRDKGSWSELERLSDNYVLNFLRPAKHIVFGLEPLIGYLLAKENEINTIRMIIIGKLNGLPIEIIKQNLRDTYA